MKKTRKEQPISMHNLQLRFTNGNAELTVVVDTNISAYEFVTDVLTEHLTICRHGSRDRITRPRFIPVFIDMPVNTPQEKLILKKCKSEWKKKHLNYKPTSVIC